MGFLSFLLVASMPIVQVLLIGVIGAYLASGYSKILTSSALMDMNKVAAKPMGNGTVTIAYNNFSGKFHLLKPSSSLLVQGTLIVHLTMLVVLVSQKIQRKNQQVLICVLCSGGAPKRWRICVVNVFFLRATSYVRLH